MHFKTDFGLSGHIRIELKWNILWFCDLGLFSWGQDHCWPSHLNFGETIEKTINVNNQSGKNIQWWWSSCSKNIEKPLRAIMLRKKSSLSPNYCSFISFSSSLCNLSAAVSRSSVCSPPTWLDAPTSKNEGGRRRQRDCSCRKKLHKYNHS